MKIQNRIWLVLGASLIGMIIWLGTLPAVSSQPTVQLQTEPPLHQVIPIEQPVRITLKAINASGQPVADANLQLRLFTPAKAPWFTSDFPIVEGTTLLELQGAAPNGVLQFEQTLPIRGNYKLDVAVIPQAAGTFEQFEQSLQMSVPENPVKYRNVFILLAILLLTGLGGGWIIGGNQTVRAGEIAPQQVRFLLSGMTLAAIAVLLYVNISAELTPTHAHSHESATTPVTAVQQVQGIKVRLSGDLQATVGQLATQIVQVTDTQTGIPIADVDLKVQAIALEDDELMFAYQGTPDATGKFAWKEQFFDGAPHQVVVDVLPRSGANQKFQPFQVAHEVEVKAIAPPFYIRFITLFYFTTIFVLGLVAALSWRRRLRQLLN